MRRDSEFDNHARPNSTEARDVAYVLHPATNAKQHLETGPYVIERGEGIYVFDNKGKRYIEALSGLWSVAVGFSEKRLVEAATRQMETLPYYPTFNHGSNEPMVDLAEKLIAIAPGRMSKAFFTNSGSEANDTVLKLLWYRTNAMGQPKRKKIIVRDRAFHGITIAATSLTGLNVNHNSFDLIVPDMIRIACPDPFREGVPGESEEAFSSRLAEQLEQKILEAGPETVCAFFAEPVQCGAGIITPPAGYWQKVQEILRRYDILLVVDEVICGFGRTGRMFGCETYDITPDVVVFSKQLSSSYMPISAALFNERVMTPIIDQSGNIGTLAHGFTGGGHPVCAAVALENIRIIEEDGLVENAALMGELLRSRLRTLLDHPLVVEVRGVGLLAAVQLAVDKTTRESLQPAGRLGALVSQALVRHGVFARLVGDAIALCPPMIITPEQIEELVGAIKQTLDEVERDIRSTA